MARALKEAGEGQRGTMTTNPISRKFQVPRRFYRDVKSEVKRVTWPTRDEVYQTTLVTIFVVFFFGYFLWGTNWALSQLVSWIIEFLSR
jgi:preprotein translocase subunit SecE